MSRKQNFPGPIQRIFDQIDALPAEDAMLFWQIALYGTRDQKTGAVVRTGLIDSAAIQLLTRAERQTAENWGRRAEYYANLYAALDEAVRAYVKRRNRQRSTATIEQDAEIARLRDSDRQRWPWKRLGNHFAMTEGGARKAYQRHKRRQARGE